MSYYIYGFRLTGDRECRYVGATKYKPEKRLVELISAARERARHGGYRLHPDGFYQWLLDNHGNIDSFKIGKVETLIEARAMERAVIALVLQLGQRLLNVEHVPHDQRIGYISTRQARAVRLQAEAA